MNSRGLQSQLEEFVRFAPFSVAMFDRGMNYLALSDRWSADCGRARADLVGANLHETLPDLPSGFKLASRQAQAGSRSECEEDRWTRADGRVWLLRWAAQPWFGARGVIGGILVSSEDIARRKPAQQELGQSDAHLAGVIDSAMDAIISIDEEQVVRLFNRSAAELFGVEAQDAIGGPLSRFIPNRLRTRHDGHVAGFTQHRSAAHRMGARWEVAGLRSDGTEVPLEGSISRTATGERRLLTVILRDISERKHVEQQMRTLRRDMENLLAQHVARQTVSAIAHELNQPLGAISAYSEAASRMLEASGLDRASLNRAVLGCAKESQRAGRSLHELIAHLQGGEVSRAVFDLNDAVRRSISIARSREGGEFNAFVVPAEAVRPALANRLQIEKVVVNLLHNGVEATREAGIRSPDISIFIAAAASGEMAQVTVRDNGPGISEDLARRVFEPFFTTKPMGVGMGLAISRSLIQANGGELWLDAGAGPGAVFHFTVPFAPNGPSPRVGMA